MSTRRSVSTDPQGLVPPRPLGTGAIGSAASGRPGRRSNSRSVASAIPFPRRWACKNGILVTLFLAGASEARTARNELTPLTAFTCNRQRLAAARCADVRKCSAEPASASIVGG